MHPLCDSRNIPFIYTLEHQRGKKLLTGMDRSIQRDTFFHPFFPLKVDPFWRTFLYSPLKEEVYAFLPLSV